MRDFKSSIFRNIFSLILGYLVLQREVEDPQPVVTLQPNTPNQTYRTSYHFQPPKNWMNDPNGPMIYKGIYHLFYQYNPYGADWDHMVVWAHSTSLDLINWAPHPLAINPSHDQQAGDINGCWSGSATILPGDEPAILYTGIDSQSHQVQMLAVPKNLYDPFLTEWVKSPHNPIMAPTTMNKINATSFRDPTTAWLGPDEIWRVIIGSQMHRRGLAILYRSKDFVNWTKAQHPLHSAEDTGVWECPDFFPVSTNSQSGLDTSMVGLGIKHVLKLSLYDTQHDYYTVGTYNLDEDIYIPDKGSVDNDSGLRYDYGKFYASKTFYDSAKHQRILWGWVNESLPQSEYVKQGWSGVQAIPRRIWLDKSGKQLVQWPISEIETLRMNQITFPTPEIHEPIADFERGCTLELVSVTAAQADVEISFEKVELEKAEEMEPSWTNPQLLCSQKNASVEGGLGPFGLKVLASEDLKEYTAVFFRIFKAQNNKYVVLMCSDQSRSSLNQNTDKTTYGAFVEVDPIHEQLSLRSLIDHSIVESFGGEGKACITARVYPTLAIGDRAHLYAFNDGRGSVRISRFSAWSMKKAHIN